MFDHATRYGLREEKRPAKVYPHHSVKAIGLDIEEIRTAGDLNASIVHRRAAKSGPRISSSGPPSDEGRDGLFDYPPSRSFLKKGGPAGLRCFLMAFHRFPGSLSSSSTTSVIATFEARWPKAGPRQIARPDVRRRAPVTRLSADGRSEWSRLDVPLSASKTGSSPWTRGRYRNDIARSGGDNPVRRPSCRSRYPQVRRRTKVSITPGSRPRSHGTGISFVHPLRCAQVRMPIGSRHAPETIVRDRLEPRVTSPPVTESGLPIQFGITPPSRMVSSPGSR